MSMSNYLEAQIRAHIFRTATFAKPAHIYVALHTADPAEDGSGAEVSSVGTGYARVQRDPADANWTAASATDGRTDNAATIAFNSPTGDWGRITHFSVWDSLTGGNYLMGGALTNAKNVNNGDPAPSFPASTLAFIFD